MFTKSIDFLVLKLGTLDLFRRPVLLYVGKKKFNSTFLGLCLSFVIYGYLFYNFLVSDIFHKKKPTQFDQASKTLSRPEQNFSFAIPLFVANDAGENFIDPTIFNVRAINYHMATDPNTTNGKIPLFKDQKELQPCSPEDFDDPKTFLELGIKNAFCMASKNVSLAGYWDEREVRYLHAYVERCSNDSSEVVCKSDQEIDSFFTNKFFGYYMPNSYSNMEDYDEPIKYYWRIEHQLLDVSLLKRIKAFIKKVEFLDDKNMVIDGGGASKETFAYDRSEFDFSMNNKDKILFEISLYSSGVIQKQVRKYQKFAEVLAAIGGQASSLMIFGFMVTALQNFVDLTSKIMNSLYSFQSPEDKRRNTSRIDRHHASITEKNLKLRTEKKIEDKKDHSVNNSRGMSHFGERHLGSGENKNDDLYKSKFGNLLPSGKRSHNDDSRAGTDNLPMKIYENGSWESSISKKSMIREELSIERQEVQHLKTGVNKFISLNRNDHTKSKIDNFALKATRNFGLKHCEKTPSWQHLPEDIFKAEDIRTVKRRSTVDGQHVNECKTLEIKSIKGPEGNYEVSEGDSNSEISKDLIFKSMNEPFRKQVVEENSKGSGKANENIDHEDSPAKLKERLNKIKHQSIVTMDILKQNRFSDNPIKFGIKDYIRMKIAKLFKQKLQPKDQLFITAEQKFRDELNIVKILRRLQDLEKLKLILLTPEQLALFSLLEKPLIYLENEDHTSEHSFADIRANTKKFKYSSRLRMSMMMNTKECDSFSVKKKIEKLGLNYYNKLLQQKNLSDVDSRLLLYIDEKSKM